MSKGHAGSVQYPYLLRNSIIKKENGQIGRKFESCFKIFPNNYIPGIDVTSGSLGHGLGIAAGISIGEKNKKKIYGQL